LLPYVYGKQVFKEEINEIIKMPDSSETKEKLCFAKGVSSSEDEAWEVVYEKEDTVYKILTFYPIIK